MSKELEPTWSKDERDQGEKEAAAWEKFFSAQEETDENADKRRSNLAEQARIAQVLADNETALLANPNVVAISEGTRTRAGKPTGEPCVTIWVKRKLPEAKLSEAEILPKEIDGIPVDVVESGTIDIQLA